MIEIQYNRDLDEFEWCLDHKGCWKYLGFYVVGGWPLEVHYSMRDMRDELDVDREAELRHEIAQYVGQIVQVDGWRGRVFANHTGSRTWRLVPAVENYQTIN